MLQQLIYNNFRPVFALRWSVDNSKYPPGGDHSPTLELLAVTLRSFSFLRRFRNLTVFNLINAVHLSVWCTVLAYSVSLERYTLARIF